jgi:excisionase family DNA binding protein
METAETKFFLTSEAARELDVSAGTVRTWEREGKLRAEHSGSGFRIFRAAELNDSKKQEQPSAVTNMSSLGLTINAIC